MTGGRKMDEERQGDSGLAYRLADVFSVRHQRFNRRMCGGAGTSGGKCGKNRVVVLTFAVIYPFYWRRIQKRKKTGA